MDLWINLDDPNPIKLKMPKRSSRFVACWAEKKECEEEIIENWTKGGDIGLNLDHYKMGFIRCFDKGRNEINKKIKELKNIIKILQFGPLDDAVATELRKLKLELEQLLDSQDIIWRRRAKVHWLANGDRNTRFFYDKATMRARNNYIHGLKGGDGILYDKVEEMSAIAVNYFNNIFQTRSSSS